jgi:MORN repeat
MITKYSLWMDDKPHGEGRMIYCNGDVYEGFWFFGKRSGYGVLTKFSFFLIFLIFCSISQT